MVANLPNEVLDLHTLEVVRAGVAKEAELYTGTFTRYERLFGIFVVGVKHCAVGAAARIRQGDFKAYFKWIDDNDLDERTLGRIIHLNDKVLRNETPANRRAVVYDWLCRNIAYATNVKKEVERLAASTPANVATELEADKAEAREPVAA